LAATTDPDASSFAPTGVDYDHRVASKKKRWSERSPAERLAVLVLTLLSVALVGAAEWDIQRRPADRIRGNKRLWRLVSLNALGAVGYFQLGRIAPHR
jgi:hypothetical protein